MQSVRSLSRIVAMGLLTLACSEQMVPVAPIAPTDRVPSAPPSSSTSIALTCRADVKALSVRCADEAPKIGGNGYITVGGQNVYVKLTSTNVVYNSTTGGPFTFDVTVQNLLPQAMGTTDGTTADSGGVKVFFQTLPTPVGIGPITITNADSTHGTFTATNQTYFKYSGAQLGADNILSPNEVSSTKNWQFNVPNTVTTFSFAVYVHAALPAEQGFITVSPSSSSVIESGTQPLTATVKSAVGNTIGGQTVTWGTSNSAVATVASNGTITAVAAGQATITATSGARTGTTTVTVCPNLALGGVSVITGPTSANFCLAGATGNEYVVVPYNGDVSSTLGVSVTATGISAVSGAPTPYAAPMTPVGLDIFSLKQDHAFEHGLRAREQALAASASRTPRDEAIVRAMRSLSPTRGPSRAITPGVPVVGSSMTLNVNANSACSAADNRTATVKAVTTHAIVLNEDDNPSGANGFAQADFDDIAATFDTLVYPLDVATFGASADIDGNSRIVILYSRAVNELTPSGSSSYVGGFVFSRDLYPTLSCATSNLGEMFYMLAPDPTGVVNGNPRSLALVKQSTIGTLAHEFQHLINASRRLYITAGAAANEDGWLNEGLSHIAEELLYYHVSGFSPRADLNLATVAAAPVVAAFNNYENANFGRFKQHLIAPETDSPLQSDDDLGTRGSAWAFLRYAADRRGGTEATFWTALVQDATLTGTANLTAALGTSVTPWLRDFAATIYDDNISAGVPATYSNPSWNFRSVYAGLGGFSLAVVNPTSGVAYAPTLALGGGASYLRMGVAASTFAPVTVTKAGGGALPSTFSVMVIRRK